MKDHWRTAWKHIFRSPYQSLAAVGIMAWVFYLTTIFFLTAVGFEQVLHYFESRPQVTAFLQDETTMEEVDSLKAKLMQTGKVKEARYVSKEEALAIYREQNKDDPLLLEMVTANILPASLEIATTEIDYLGEVAEVLREEPKVEEVVFQQDVVNTLREKTRAIRLIGIELVASLVVVSLFVILMVVGMKVVLRREEIKVLRLIGASPAYIRAPFIMEGVFYCQVGAVLGWAIAYLRLLYSTPFLVDFLGGIPILPTSLVFMLAVLGGELVLGALIGILGSLIAAHRYLR